jgi:hypothetical protein
VQADALHSACVAPDKETLMTLLNFGFINKELQAETEVRSADECHIRRTFGTHIRNVRTGIVA